MGSMIGLSPWRGEISVNWKGLGRTLKADGGGAGKDLYRRLEALPVSSVLVVDDARDLRDVVVTLLKYAGFKACAAPDGREALLRLEADPDTPSAVLLDISMPEMNGFEVLQTMQANPRLKAIPVVMFSALSDPNQIQKALQLGAKGYLIKSDLTFEGVVNELRRVCPTIDA
jgi:CheY-like chemotaxis protein